MNEIARGDSGFWGVNGINEQRVSCFEKVHPVYAEVLEEQTMPKLLEKIAYYGLHKVLTVICLPMNIIGAGVGAFGLYPLACAATAVKVCIKAVTGEEGVLHTHRPLFEAATKHSLRHLRLNIVEVCRDGADVVSFIFRRLREGWNAAAAREAKSNEPLKSTPYPVNLLNDLTDKFRIKWNKEDRELANIGKHTICLIANVPVNAATFICGVVASVFFGTLFIGKTVLFAAAKLDVPVPTYTLKSLHTTFTTANNVRVDLRDLAYDAVATLQKAAQALKINQLYAKAKELWDFIPKAFHDQDFGLSS